MYDSAIFDLDGTLLNTIDDLASSVNHCLDAFGFPVHTTKEIRTYIGHGISNLIRRSLPEDHKEDDYERVYALFKEYYPKHATDETVPYPGILSLLSSLKEHGIKTAIVSNKNDYSVQILNEHFFNGLIDIAVGERKGIRKKPDPSSVLEVMERLGSKNPLYIGDSSVDFDTAANAGVDCCLVTWGFGIDVDKLHAKYTVDTADELRSLFHI